MPSQNNNPSSTSSESSSERVPRLRIIQIEVEELFGEFSAKIPLNHEDGITILHGPNGCGKTTLLRLMEHLQQGNQFMISRIPFKLLRLKYADGRTETITREERLLNVKEIEEQARKIHEVEGYAGGGEHPAHEVVRKTYPEVFNPSFGVSSSASRPTPGTIPVTFLYTHIEPNGWAHTYIDWFDIENCAALIEQKLGLKYDVLERAFNRRSETGVLQKMSFDEAFLEYGCDHSDFGWWEVAQQMNWSFANDLRLIGTNRGTKTDIDRCSDLLKRLWDSARRSYEIESQRQDEKIPALLLAPTDEASQMDEETIRSDYATVMATKKKLESLGIITSQVPDIELPTGVLDEFQKRVFPIFTRSLTAKLSVFEEFGNEVDCLLRFANKNLVSKKIVLSPDGPRALTVQTESGKQLHVDQLSSGERHLVCLITDLIFNLKETDLYLIDEPEISLHVTWQRTFLEMLKEIARLKGASFFIATHSPQIVGEFFDNLVALKSRYANANNE